jgi:hypothetical protein
MPTNTLTDEILTPGKGQIRALIVNGGNPALVFSDTEHTLKALDQLDLLVVNDLFMSATAKHADYVMAVKRHSHVVRQLLSLLIQPVHRKDGRGPGRCHRGVGIFLAGGSEVGDRFQSAWHRG